MGRSNNRSIDTLVEASLAKAGVTKADSILIGVSGGVDSIVLATILYRLQKKKIIKALAIAHVDHLLRGKASKADEAFVKDLASSLKTTYYCETVDVQAFAKKNKLGIEEAGRELRYEFFKRVATTEGYKFVATAHHADDTIETIVMNILRGSGVKGLRGIPTSRELTNSTILLRPMLNVSRSEILEFAKKEQLAWREDISNSDENFKRNYIRKKIIPSLVSASSEELVHRSFLRLADNAAAIYDMIEREAAILRKNTQIDADDNFFPQYIRMFDRHKLLAGPFIVVRELLCSEIESISEKPFTLLAELSESIEMMLKVKRPTAIQIEKRITISVGNDSLTLTYIPGASHITEELTLRETINTEIGKLSLKVSKRKNLRANKNLCPIPKSLYDRHGLMVRNAVPSDIIKPFGMKGTKRVGALLSEAGIKNEALKRLFPVVVLSDEPKTIIWLPGIRASELCRASTSETVLLLSRNSL